VDVVTGAFSFTGRAIAEELLARGRSVRTLSRRPAESGDPLGVRVEWAPLQFSDPVSLRERLRGAEVLYTTYWIRFERGGSTFARAVENIRLLIQAAREAGVRRVVHVSVANPSEDSPFAYYRGKARAEAWIVESGLSYAIVRPTLVYGPNDILLNNIAWTVRHFPFFAVVGDGAYRVQPVAVAEVAGLCADAGEGDRSLTFDAAGPETYTYVELVRLIAAALGRPARIVRLPSTAVLALAKVVGMTGRDVLVNSEELGALRAETLVSHNPPTAQGSFATWLDDAGAALGERYASELARNFRSHEPL
jgi:NADH dehydrogenase